MDGEPADDCNGVNSMNYKKVLTKLEREIVEPQITARAIAKTIRMWVASHDQFRPPDGSPFLSDEEVADELWRLALANDVEPKLVEKYLEEEI